MTDLQACHALLARLDGNGTVTTKEVRQAIGAAHADELRARMDQASWQRSEAGEASIELRDYIEQVRIADLLSGRSDNAKSGAQAKKLMEKAEQRYERAIERLDELLTANPSLAQHLDRDFDLHKGGGAKVAPDVEAIPRIKYHARAYGEHVHREIPSRVELLRGALQSAIADPVTTAPTAPVISQQQRDEQSALIEAKLKALRSV